MRDVHDFIAGPYKPPRAKRGSILTCEVRDCECIVLRWSDSPLPWPMGRARKRRSVGFIVTSTLAGAIATESAAALCHALSITPQTITKWRKALGVPKMAPGTTQRFRDVFAQRITPAIRRKMIRLAHTPEANRKRSLTMIGVPRPAHVRRLLDRTGKPVSAATRKKLSATHRKLGTWPPAAGELWTRAEDAVLRRLSVAEVVAKTGRTMAAVYGRRHELGLADGRHKA